MLTFIYAEFCMQALYAECHYPKCRYAERHGTTVAAFFRTLEVERRFKVLKRFTTRTISLSWDGIIKLFTAVIVATS
jgi:hypothetical protein